MMNKRGMGIWMWILIILILLGIGVFVYFLFGVSDGGSIINGGNSIPQPPALPG